VKFAKLKKHVIELAR